ncbi:MAG: hypothetical protein DRI01_09380 [Chloroflexi bacterium]|nr:MAG: hypothetical protein DRI01_09380 [Chloroflexota bacterium]
MKPFIKVIVERRESDEEIKYELESVWSMEVEELCNKIYEMVDEFFRQKIFSGKKEVLIQDA